MTEEVIKELNDRRVNKTSKILDLIENPHSRRAFAKNMGFAGLGIAGATLLGGTLTKAVAQTTSPTSTTFTATDIDVLNFALNLEYLEAEFYTVATAGRTLLQAGLVPSSAQDAPTTGGRYVQFGRSTGGNLDIGAVAQAVTRDEQSHVKALRTALGAAAINKPAINLDALGLGFRNVKEFLTLSRAFEDTGVSAYGGAAPLLSPFALKTAALIALTEAQHSGNFRIQVLSRNINVPLLDALDVIPTQKTPFFVNTMGLSIPRTPGEVLNIVYGGGTTRGGFFPNGVNASNNGVKGSNPALQTASKPPAGATPDLPS